MSSLKKTASAINIGTPKLKRVSHEELEQFCLFRLCFVFFFVYMFIGLLR